MEKLIFEIFLWRIYIGDVEKICFPIFFKSTSRVCFSDSARKMTQNGGRVVAIGWIFDMNIKAYVRNKEKKWTIESLVMADPNFWGAA